MNSCAIITKIIQQPCLQEALNVTQMEENALVRYGYSFPLLPSQNILRDNRRGLMKVLY